MPSWCTYPGWRTTDPNPSAIPIMTCCRGTCSRDPFARPEPVLKGDDHVVGSQQWGDVGRHLRDILRLGRDHPQVARSSVSGCRTGAQTIDDVTAAGPGDAEPGPGDGIEVLLPDIDGPQLVSGLAQSAVETDPMAPVPTMAIFTAVSNKIRLMRAPLQAPILLPAGCGAQARSVDPPGSELVAQARGRRFSGS